jgi:hypothetical protein
VTLYTAAESEDQRVGDLDLDDEEVPDEEEEEEDMTGRGMRDIDGDDEGGGGGDAAPRKRAGSATRRPTDVERTRELLRSALQTLYIRAANPKQSLACTFVRLLFVEIVSVLTDHAECLVVDIKTPVTPKVQMCYDILNLVCMSCHRAVCTPFFFRVMVAKAGIRTNLASEDFLSR